MGKESVRVNFCSADAPSIVHFEGSAMAFAPGADAIGIPGAGGI